MSRLKIIYIVSLAVLGVLVGLAVVRPATAGNGYTEVSREQLIQIENGYVIRFDILNHEGKEMVYTIRISFDDYRYSQDIAIPDGRGFTYAHNIYPDRLTQGDVSFTVYKAGEPSPFEEITYHLK